MTHTHGWTRAVWLGGENSIIGEHGQDGESALPYLGLLSMRCVICLMEQYEWEGGYTVDGWSDRLQCGEGKQVRGVSYDEDGTRFVARKTRKCRVSDLVAVSAQGGVGSKGVEWMPVFE